MARIFTTALSTESVSLASPRLSLVPSTPSIEKLPPAGVRMIRTTVTRATASSSATGKREPRGIMRPRRVSPEMAELVGTNEISRTQALKLIWAHIKDNNLQDPNNKKIIICDEKLKKIFDGKDQVGFLEIAGLISPHFLK
ncbi:hypothetical protein K2173_023892 [Erythroxylum novogranatense]|uniref:DM2 domain-containing protein n=1 Tax=Erythroxylum novogranatense TaxID=1862640 RepID=A0AAV8TPQ1_9ROSI|nr:hypothetical protein K2173_023892 [Erythroxylum novogranatense]